MISFEYMYMFEMVQSVKWNVHYLSGCKKTWARLFKTNDIVS